MMTKRDRINSLAKQIGDLVPKLEAGRGGAGFEIHEITSLTRHLAIELDIISDEKRRQMNDYLNMSKAELREAGFCEWNKESGILLIPEAIFKQLLESIPNGTILYRIDGKECVVGEHNFDDDTRGGFVAYGLKPRR